MEAKDLVEELRKISSPKKAESNQWFFKTGKGEYGYGDKFLGVTVPQIRRVAKKFQALKQRDIQQLLKSEFHEVRFCALLILVTQFGKCKLEGKEKIYNFYLQNTRYINNWDLVDLSAPNIIGEYVLLNKNIDILYKLAKSENLWERRIAILSTFPFIKEGNEDLSFEIADILLFDKHDLIQKAVGWMLREGGKRISEDKLEGFLKLRYKKMPRTMLRYAIERFDEDKRKKYLNGLL